uniref:ribonuclease H n=1 Tax=Latimeria chalumnae TaxID=7897 RepID=H3A8S3_LATCH
PVQVDLEGLAQDLRDRLVSLLWENHQVLSKDDRDLGYMEAGVHQIPTGNAESIKQRHRPVSPQVIQELKKHVQHLVAQGILCENHSPWASPTAIVKKKDGNIGYCCDYRKLNSVTCKDAYSSLPSVEDSLDVLGQAKLFSTLHLTSSYFQVAWDPADQAKTAVTTPFGLFEWTRMPFGLCNAPATFQRLMETVLGDYILDDILVFSKDFDSHLERLQLVVRLKKYGLKMKPSKCYLFRSEVPYLGHIMSADGVKVDREKIKILEERSVPQNPRDLCIMDYRWFIPKFSQIALPLHLLIGKPRKGGGAVPFSWDEACQAAADGLKCSLMAAPVLAYPDFSQAFILATYTSFNGLAAVLSQKQEGIEHVILNMSRGLRKSEQNDQNYSAFKLELPALKWALTKKFRVYLVHSELIIHTDHSPLKYL